MVETARVDLSASGGPPEDLGACRRELINTWQQRYPHHAGLFAARILWK